jgi:hypothetical protein
MGKAPNKFVYHYKVVDGDKTTFFKTLAECAKAYKCSSRLFSYKLAAKNKNNDNHRNKLHNIFIYKVHEPVIYDLVERDPGMLYF